MKSAGVYCYSSISHLTESGFLPMMSSKITNIKIKIICWLLNKNTALHYLSLITVYGQKILKESAKETPFFAKHHIFHFVEKNFILLHYKVFHQLLHWLTGK